MNTLQISIAESYGTDLSNRHRAAVLRAQLLKAAADGTSPVVVDFAGVRTLSDSFADELFGILVVEQGPEWFRNRLSAVNLAPDVRLTVLSAIQGRIERQQAEHAGCETH